MPDEIDLTPEEDAAADRAMDRRQLDPEYVEVRKAFQRQPAGDKAAMTAQADPRTTDASGKARDRQENAGV